MAVIEQWHIPLRCEDEYYLVQVIYYNSASEAVSRYLTQ